MTERRRLKPGIYTWMVSFWDREELIDMGDLAPEFHVVAQSFQHPRDEWTGLLNLPSEFTVRPRDASILVAILITGDPGPKSYFD